MAGFVVFCRFLYKEITEFYHEIVTCLTDTTLASSQNGHVRFNSQQEIFNIEEAETVPYVENWSDLWSTSARPLSPVSRNLVKNVFTRNKIERRHQLTSVPTHIDNNNDNDAIDSYLCVLHGKINKGEAVVLPNFVTVNYDPMVLSRGYRVLDSEYPRKEVDGVNLREPFVSAKNIQQVNCLPAADVVKKADDVSIESSITKCSSSFVAVCRDIDLLLIKSHHSLTPPTDVESVGLIPKDDSMDSDTTTSSALSSVVLVPSSDEEELVCSPLKRPRFGTVVDINGLSPVYPVLPDAETESSLLPTHEKEYKENESRSSVYSMLPQHQYSGTIYDHL